MLFRDSFLSRPFFRAVPTILFTLQCAAVHPTSAGERFASVQLIGITQIAGTARDRSGQQDKLINGVPHNRLGGFSALEYSGVGHRYVALPDRGPDDGATGYRCRFHVLDIAVSLDESPAVTVKLIETVALTNEQRLPFTGDATAFSATATHAGRLDPEGLRIHSSGHFFLSDEYGPQLLEFDAEGRVQRRFRLPEHLTIRHPADSKDAENALNQSGRASNKGMEGLALSPDGSQLYGLMQHVLLQDGVRDEQGRPVGRNCRIVQVDVTTGAIREFVYQLDAPTNGLNEILAINNEEFLVIERDGVPGKCAKFKKIMKISLAGATSVHDLDQLPLELPKSIRPVAKEVLIDFLSPEFSLSAEQIPEKLEGLTFGPRLADGRVSLVVASDNDFIETSPSLIYVFGLD